MARRADAQRRRAAAHRDELHARVHRDARCARRAARASSPAPIPSRHGVTLTLTDGDLWPDPRNAPDVLRTVARPGGERRGAARRGWRAPSCAACCGSGPKSGNEPELPPGIADARDAAARARLPRRAEGQVAPDQAGRRRRAGAPPTRSGIERDYGFADWEPPDAGGDAKAETFGGGNAGTTQRGLGRGLHAPDGGLARAGATCPSRSASSSRSSTRTTCSATRRSYERRRLHGATSSATSACRCRRRSTRTCATSRRSRR